MRALGLLLALAGCDAGGLLIVEDAGCRGAGGAPDAGAGGGRCVLNQGGGT